jgi:hypothetical protein
MSPLPFKKAMKAVLGLKKPRKIGKLEVEKTPGVSLKQKLFNKIKKIRPLIRRKSQLQTNQLVPAVVQNYRGSVNLDPKDLKVLLSKD